MTKPILVPIDLNHESSWRKALPRAVDLARADGVGLCLLNVIPDFGMSIVGSYFPEDFSEKAEKEGRAALDDLAARLVPDDVEVDCEVVHGTIYKGILQVARQRGCDLIVLASHRSDMKDYLIGPNAARVARHATCSVLIVRE